MATLPSSARLLRALLTVTALFPVVQACGGRSDTEDYLFNSDGTVSVAGADGAGAASTGGTRSGRGGTSTGATGNNGATSSTGATTGTGATSNTGATSSTGGSGIAGMVGEGGEGGTGIGGIGGSGVAGMPQGGIAGEAGAPPTGPVVTCGGQTCDADTQTCCFAGFGGFSCIKKGNACNGAVLGCTTNKDCAGDVCCIGITGDVSAASSCKARCDNMGTGRERQLCDSDDDCRMPFRFCTPTVFGVNICTRRP